MPEPDQTADGLIARADRLDELADAAALMGDDPTAATLHEAATRCREHAMTHLDHEAG